MDPKLRNQTFSGYKYLTLYVKCVVYLIKGEGDYIDMGYGHYDDGKPTTDVTVIAFNSDKTEVRVEWLGQENKDNYMKLSVNGKPATNGFIVPQVSDDPVTGHHLTVYHFYLFDHQFVCVFSVQLDRFRPVCDVKHISHWIDCRQSTDTKGNTIWSQTFIVLLVVICVIIILILVFICLIYRNWE